MEDYFSAEFGPAFVEILGSYSGYDDSVDASVRSFFSSAAFRYGHSSLRGYKSLDECGASTVQVFQPFLPPGSELPNIGQTGGPLNLLGMLYVAGNVGFKTIIRGLLSARTRPIDTKRDDGIRNIILPGAIKNVGVDLFSLDILRGRLNGIPNYDRLRSAYHPDGSVYGSPG